jgi:hypothetical protein
VAAPDPGDRPGTPDRSSPADPAMPNQIIEAAAERANVVILSGIGF